MGCETGVGQGGLGEDQTRNSPSSEVFLSVRAKLLPRNQRDMAPSVQMESPGTGQEARNPRVPRDSLGAVAPPG